MSRHLQPVFCLAFKNRSCDSSSRVEIIGLGIDLDHLDSYEDLVYVLVHHFYVDLVEIEVSLDVHHEVSDPLVVPGVEIVDGGLLCDVVQENLAFERLLDDNL